MVDCVIALLKICHCNFAKICMKAEQFAKSSISEVVMSLTVLLTHHLYKQIRIKWLTCLLQMYRFISILQKLCQFTLNGMTKINNV